MVLWNQRSIYNGSEIFYDKCDAMVHVTLHDL